MASNAHMGYRQFNVHGNQSPHRLWPFLKFSIRKNPLTINNDCKGVHLLPVQMLFHFTDEIKTASDKQHITIKGFDKVFEVIHLMLICMTD